MAASRLAALRRLLRRLRPPRRVRPTRAGWLFIAMTAAVLAASVNTGNNLLYLVTAMMLSTIGLSSILSESAIKSIQIERRADGWVMAGRQSRFLMTARNPRRFLPNVAVTVEELPGDEEVRGAPVFYPHVPAGGARRTTASVQLPRRGRHVLSGVRISTTFPLGLFHKSYTRALPCEVLVFPRVRHIAGEIGLRQVRGGEVSSPRKGSEGDLNGLRELRPDDDARRIHWKRSAGRPTPILVEWSEHEQPETWVHLAAPPAGPDRIDEFERRVEQAASEAVHLLGRGERVGLETPGGRVAPAQGRGQQRRILAHLAVVELPR